MKSVFTNDEGKYPAAVYECSTTSPFTEDQVAKIFPRSYGKNVTAYGWTTTSHERRWMMLIANSVQTTVRDITIRLDRMGIVADVRVIATVSEIGRAEIVGTPRRGMRVTKSRTPHGRTVTAR